MGIEAGMPDVSRTVSRTMCTSRVVSPVTTAVALHGCTNPEARARRATCSYTVPESTNGVTGPDGATGTNCSAQAAITSDSDSRTVKRCITLSC
jgi:hypothetical protein